MKNKDELKQEETFIANEKYAVEIKGLDFSYKSTKVFEDLNLNILKGKMTCVLGHNGSGKSTLAKLIIGLLEAKKGQIYVQGEQLTDKNYRDIRSEVGIVFQNPDNQFVGVTVEEDIAFGLENHNIPREQIRTKITEYAKKVEMSDFLSRNPHQLSGGQKQRVAIAGVLSMDPKMLIFDESTSMLDPRGKKEVFDMIRNVHDDGRHTILSITHDIKEAMHADYVIVLNKGEVVLEGTPGEIVKYPEILAKSNIELPSYMQSAIKLYKSGKITSVPTTIEGLVNEICK